MALSSDSNTLYVGNTGGESISIVDLTQMAVVGIGGFPGDSAAGRRHHRDRFESARAGLRTLGPAVPAGGRHRAPLRNGKCSAAMPHHAAPGYRHAERHGQHAARTLPDDDRFGGRQHHPDDRRNRQRLRLQRPDRFLCFEGVGRDHDADHRLLYAAGRRSRRLLFHHRPLRLQQLADPALRRRHGTQHGGDLPDRCQHLRAAVDSGQGGHHHDTGRRSAAAARPGEFPERRGQATGGGGGESALHAARHHAVERFAAPDGGGCEQRRLSC